MKKRDLEISNEELLKGARLALNNAHDFIEEGIVFYRKSVDKRMDRAYAAYQFALEETGKAYLLVEEYRERKIGMDVQLRKNLKYLFSHTRKTQMALKALLLAYEGMTEFAEHVEIIKSLMRNASEYETKRQNSLYTSFSDGAFFSPNDIITENDAHHAELIAISSFHIVEQFWYVCTEVGYLPGSKGLEFNKYFTRAADRKAALLDESYIRIFKNHLMKHN